MQYSEVKELISIFEATDLTELELSIDNVALRLNRGAIGQNCGKGREQSAFQMVQQETVQGKAAVSSDKAAEEDHVQAKAAVLPVEDSAVEQTANRAAEGRVITAPLVGTFYASAAPDKPAFVSEGDKVQKGDVVCIVGAMKFMNEISSDLSGTVAEVLVKDGDFVEYGQPLIRIV